MEIAKKICNKQDYWKYKAPTIAFLGDSVTQGCFELLKTSDGVETAFDYSSAYSTRLKEILEIIFPYTQVNIINSGISGATAHSGLILLDREILPHNPDLLVVSFGLNDAATYKKEGIEKYLNSLKKIFTKAKNSGCEIIFMTQNYMCDHVSRYMVEPSFIKIAKEMADIQNSGTLDFYFDSAKKLCNEMDIKVCDMYSIWDKFNKYGADTTELLANKINHPKKDVHYYMALKLIETMFDI